MDYDYPEELQLVMRELAEIKRNLDLFEETKDGRFIKEAASMIKANAPRIKALSSKDDYKLPGSRKEGLTTAKNTMRDLFARAKHMKSSAEGGSASPAPVSKSSVAGPASPSPSSPSLPQARPEPTSNGDAHIEVASSSSGPKDDKSAGRRERKREQEMEMLREAEEQRAEMLAQMEEKAIQDAAEEERMLRQIRQPTKKGEKRGDDLWSKALDERDGGENNPQNEDEHHTLVFVGEPNAGKTTQLQRVLEISDSVEPTVGMEYSYGTRPKRMSNSQARDIIHAWELAGGSEEMDLLQAAIVPHNLHVTTVAVWINLASPRDSFERALFLLETVRRRVDECMKSLKVTQDPKLEIIQKRNAAIFDGHQDRSSVKPLGVPLVVVGGQYDVFEDFDPQTRKIACKAIRYLALLYGGAVVFTSKEEEALVSRLRTTLYTAVLRHAPRKASSTDPHKPLLVPVATDTFDTIGTPSGTGNAHSVGISAWKSEWEDLFAEHKGAGDGQEDNSQNIEDTVKYAEHSIDAARLDRDQELEKYKREAAIRSRGNATFSSSSTAAPSSQFERSMAKRSIG